MNDVITHIRRSSSMCWIHTIYSGRSVVHNFLSNIKVGKFSPYFLFSFIHLVERDIENKIKATTATTLFNA